MKRYIILFWHGLTGILSSIAEWFTVVLGMKDDSKYGKVIRRTVGTQESPLDCQAAWGRFACLLSNGKETWLLQYVYR